MFNISSYLEKFKKIYSTNLYFKETVIKAVKETTGIDVDKESINYKNGVLTLNVKPIQKSELFLKKKLILSRLNEKSSSKIVDLR